MPHLREEARGTLLRRDYDVLVTDLRLAGFNGLHVAKMARDKAPGMRIVVISGSEDTVLRREARRQTARLR